MKNILFRLSLIAMTILTTPIIANILEHGNECAPWECGFN